jgi:hypothetical protein
LMGVFWTTDMVLVDRMLVLLDTNTSRYGMSDRLIGK